MAFLSRTSTTVLQGLAILLIISCHYIGGGYEVRYLTPLGGIGVAVFLFVSGFGLAESNNAKGVNFFWEKKVVRILVPYLLWLPFFWLIVWLIPLNCTLSHPFPRYWYLEYLFLFYAVYWIFARWLPKYTIIGLICVGAASFFVFPCLQAEQSFSFLLGVVVSKYKAKFQEIAEKKYLIYAIVLFASGVLLLAVKQMPQIRSFGENSLMMKLVQLMMKSSFALSLVVLINLIVESQKVGWLMKILSILGAYSLEAYLVQMTFWNSINHSWTKLLLFLFVTIVVSVSVHYLSGLISKTIKKFIKST